MHGTRQATAIGIVAILLWAALALLTVQAAGIPPFELLALSFAVAAAAGLAVLAARGRPALAQLRPKPAPWLLAFGGLFAYHALYFFALSAAPPAHASLVAYLWPLLIVLLSAAAPGGESLRLRHLAGALLGLAGTALILSQHAADTPASSSSWAGYAAAFGCAVVWSGYSVLNRRFAQTPSAMLVGVCAAVAAAGLAFHVGLETSVRPAGAQWWAVLLLGLGPTGLAFLAWDHATKRGRLPVLGALSYLAPLISTLLLVGAGRAVATPALLTAALLILGGAVLAAGIRRQAG